MTQNLPYQPSQNKYLQSKAEDHIESVTFTVRIRGKWIEVKAFLSGTI